MCFDYIYASFIPKTSLKKFKKSKNNHCMQFILPPMPLIFKCDLELAQGQGEVCTLPCQVWKSPSIIIRLIEDIPKTEGWTHQKFTHILRWEYNNDKALCMPVPFVFFGPIQRNRDILFSSCLFVTTSFMYLSKVKLHHTNAGKH